MAGYLAVAHFGARNALLKKVLSMAAESESHWRAQTSRRDALPPKAGIRPNQELRASHWNTRRSPEFTGQK
jgi:hypothetical protein